MKSFLPVFRIIQPVNRGQLHLGDPVHHVLKLHRLGLAGHFLDRGKDQWRPGGQHVCQLPYPVIQFWPVGKNLVHQPPAMRLAAVHPAPGQQHIHRHMIGDAFWQLDGGGIGQGAGLDFRQGKAGCLGRQNQIAGQCQFEPATDTHTFDGSNNRLVQIAQFLQSGKAANTIIADNRVAGGSGLEIPAG